MRQSRFAPPVLLALATALAPALWGQDEGLSIANYQLVNAQQFNRTQWQLTYRAELLNTGPARPAVTATASSGTSGLIVLPGRNALHFAPVPANSQALSRDTFSVFVDFGIVGENWLSRLRWSFLNPVADAGPNQTVAVGSTVRLNGAGSSNPLGVGALAYFWSFESRPKESKAAIENATSPVLASFVVDVPGEYRVSLRVQNGFGQDTAVVRFATSNSPPVAQAGANQTAAVGANVVLDGSGSSDVDGDPLTYLWTMTTRPAGSNANLASSRSVTTSFTPDVEGRYVIELVVNDGHTDSAPSAAAIAAGNGANTPPVAHAGGHQTVVAGAVVQLDGAGSTDVDGDALTYRWLIVSKPDASAAQLSSPTAVNPTFTADLAGIYIVQLIVNDGKADSAPATAIVTTNPNANERPTANAGLNQTVAHGSMVRLNGSGTDPHNRPLTYQWSLISIPSGSVTGLSDRGVPDPWFVADRPGTYVAQLVVSNGIQSSPPSTVTITTMNTPPVANAGSNRSAPVGFLLQLDGGGSVDANADPLSYSWSFTTRPESSGAVLSAANSRTPTFTPDVAGVYVIQLVVNDGFVNSAPATVTITAVVARIVLTPDPLNLLNVPGKLTVTVNPPAGPSGATITFLGYDPAVVTLPASVLIPANAASVEVTVTPRGSGGTYIYATGPGYQPTAAAVQVTVPSVAVTLNGFGVAVGRSLGGSVQLSAPAPPGGADITLASTPAGRVTFVPPVVHVAAGQTSAAFTLTGATAGPATIAAGAGGYETGATANLLVVALLGGIFMEPEITVEAESSVTIVVQLSSPAPAGGVTVSLVSDNPAAAQVTGTIFIPQGAFGPAVPARVAGIAAGVANISATAQNYVPGVQTVTVTPKPKPLAGLDRGDPGPGGL